MSFQFYNNWPYTYTVFPTMENHVDPVNNEYFAGLHTEIENIENELGLNPSGTHDTVVSRLESIESNIDTVETDLNTAEGEIDALQILTPAGSKVINVNLMAVRELADNSGNIDISNYDLRLRTLASNIHFRIPVYLPVPGQVYALTTIAECVGVTNVITTKLYNLKYADDNIPTLMATHIATDCGYLTSTPQLTIADSTIYNGRQYFIDIEFDCATAVAECRAILVTITIYRPQNP